LDIHVDTHINIQLENHLYDLLTRGQSFPCVPFLLLLLLLEQPMPLLLPL
jgi:hypothetical protein